MNKMITIDSQLETLTVRTYNILKRAGIQCVQDLESLTFTQLFSFRNISIKTIKEIITLLNSFNIDKFNNEFEQYKKERANLIIGEVLQRVNKMVKYSSDKKINSLLNLANNDGATLGEKRNALLAIQRILNINLNIPELSL